MRLKLETIRIIVINIFVLFLFFFDRYAKLLFIKNPSISYGGDFFVGLKLATNEGVAFGLAVNQTFLIICIVVIMIILFYYLIQFYSKNKLIQIFSVTLILFGAISNYIDRIWLGYIVDYIDVSFFTVFNIADGMITVGAIFLMLAIWFDKGAGQTRKKELK